MKYSWGRTFDNTMEKRKYGSEDVFRKEFEKAVSVNFSLFFNNVLVDCEIVTYAHRSCTSLGSILFSIGLNVIILLMCMLIWFIFRSTVLT